MTQPPAGSPTTAWIPTDGCDCATCNVARRSTPVEPAGASEPPSETRKTLEYVTAQLRHAYKNIHGKRVSRRGMEEFANGLIAPQIRRLEGILRDFDQPTQGEPEPCVWREFWKDRHLKCRTDCGREMYGGYPVGSLPKPVPFCPFCANPLQHVPVGGSPLKVERWAMSDDIERVSLLEEAHRGHRAEIAALRAELASMRRTVGERDGVIGPGRGDLLSRVQRLENGGLTWTTDAARDLLSKLTRVRDALDEIFTEPDHD